MLADECVAMCPATQIWCDAKAPGGQCAPVDGVRGGWRNAAYVAAAGADDATASAVPMNILWMATNRTDIVPVVPCVRAECVASGFAEGQATPTIASSRLKTDDDKVDIGCGAAAVHAGRGCN